MYLVNINQINIIVSMGTEKTSMTEVLRSNTDSVHCTVNEGRAKVFIVVNDIS